MGLMGIRARYAGLDPELDGVTAAEWVRGMAGERAFNILWKPLLSAKIGDHYAALPALWLSSRMNREKNTGPEQKGCLKRGYRSLIDAFKTGLESRGTTVRMKTKVEAIERAGEGMAIRFQDGHVENYDFVVSTVPLVLFQQLTRGLALDPALSGLKLDYQGVISGVFLTRAPLTHYYWMPFVDSGAMAQGAIEMSNLVPLERSKGLHVNYLVNYTHRSGELYSRTDQQLLDGYRKDLETFFPAAGKSIVDQFLFRAPYVEPIWTVNYNRVKPPASVIPGRLYLSCTAQLYPRVNSWNSCCEIVEAMMPKLAAETSALAAEKRSAIA
jgi:protoporphyrinogen oxidase